MAKTKKKTRHRHSSLFMGALDSLTSLIYSIFANGRAGSWMSSGREDSESSIFVRGWNKLAHAFRGSETSESVDLILKKSRFAKATESIRSYLSNLSLGVYGLLLLVYGIVSIFVYFIPILLGRQNSQGESALLTAIIIAICAVPMTLSTRSLQTQVSESGVFRKIVLSFLAIPEEKLRPGKRIGGAVHMLISATIGLAFAGLTYFLHPAYILAIIVVITVFCLISANPESGVALTLVAIPFLQYIPNSAVFLAALVIVTVYSYASKILKRRRVLEFSIEGIIVVIFSGFILVAGLFSVGGYKTFVDSALAVIIIIGAFITTYNLTRGKRLLNSFVKILGVSFAVLSFIAVFSVFYNGIVDGVTYSIRDYVQPIFEGNNLYIVDNSSVFSVLAVLSFPMFFAFMAKRKSVIGIVTMILISLVMIGGCFIYGTYETVMAIVIEGCIFWLLYSHKTVNVVTVLLIPVCIFIAVFPYIAAYIDVTKIISHVGEFMPIALPDGAYHIEIGKSTCEMLKAMGGGIGAGTHAFQTAIEPYITSASRGAQNAGNFWLQVICWSGFGGFVTFLLALGLVFKNSLGFLAVSKDKELRVNALALFCGLFGAVLFGGVNCLWDEPRMLYLFWAMLGVLAAYVREGRALSDKNDANFEKEIESYDVELIFHK